MAEWDWRKPIELYIDQQVFIDAVQGRESVQELSALTEVDSFEQRGEELYLEGHILFTAFLGLHEPETGGADAIRQVQHRMPFDLAVPVAVQVAGTLHVAVEVPEATLDVLGPGWIHIRAVMKVDGLVGEGGYIVHCGAQEAVVPAVSASAEPEDAGEKTSAPAPAVFAQTHPSESAVPDPDALQDMHETEEEPAFAARQETEEPSTGQDWKTQLEEADRALTGTFTPFKTGQSSPETKSPEARQDVAPIAAFHYEGMEKSAPPAVPEVPAKEQQEQDVRREWDDTLFATGIGDFPGLIPVKRPPGREDEVLTPVREDVQQMPPVGASPLPEQDAKGVQTSYTAVPESPVEMSAAQWFWKTLNVPDGAVTATMKFRIVQVDETLDGIAQMYRVNVTELLRVNHRAVETVEAGDLLYIPVHP